MESASPERVIERIEAAFRAHAGGAIAFAGDGTLWSGDVGEDFFGAVLSRGSFSGAATRALGAMATELGLAPDGDGVALAERIYGAYVRHEAPEDRVCEMMAWAVAGETTRSLAAFCDRLVDAVDLPSRLHAEAIQVVRWGQGRGIAVHLVSASPRCVVEAAARVLGIESVIAATPEMEGETVLASVVRPIPYGEGKVHGLRARMGAAPLLAAFGDNAFDVAMLKASHVPVAVRPKPRLTERAHEVPGLITIERR